MTQRHRDPSTLTHSLGRRRKTPIALNSESRIAVERRTCHKWSNAMLLLVLYGCARLFTCIESLYSYTSTDSLIS